MVTSALLLLSALVSGAQSRSLGATFSFTGMAVSYEHELQRLESFIEVSLKAESSEMLLNRAGFPGVSGSFTWNIPVREWLSSEGNRITFFAGPGAAVGYAKDFKMPDGIFFGLKGRAGVECGFDRHVIISAFISPIIGSHIEFYEDRISMRHYRNGLIYALVPEIGVKYRF